MTDKRTNLGDNTVESLLPMRSNTLNLTNKKTLDKAISYHNQVKADLAQKQKNVDQKEGVYLAKRNQK